MTIWRASAWRRQADRLVAERAAVAAGLRQARSAVIAGEAALDAADEAQQIVQLVAKTVQETAHDRIAGVVTRCLAAVFDEPYEFHVRFEQARGRTEARLVFSREGMEVNPIDASGGGVVDVAAFALRISCLMLTRPASRRVVILDEPFKHLSKEYIQNASIFLAELVNKIGRQVIVVTHVTSLANESGNVIKI